LCVLFLWNGALPANPAWRQGSLLLEALKHRVRKCTGNLYA
jgi:hypothetical protein